MPPMYFTAEDARKRLRLPPRSLAPAVCSLNGLAAVVVVVEDEGRAT